MDEINKISWKDRLRSFFVPTFSRNYLYLTSLTLLIFSLFNDNFTVAFIFIAMFWQLVIVFEVCGVLSIYSALTDRPMGKTTKNMMLVYVIVLNFMIAVACFLMPLIFNSRSEITNLSLIFPAINVLDAILLFLLFKGDILTEKSIEDDKIDIVELAIGSAAVVLIYAIGIYVWRISWPIVFSMCVFYSGHIGESFSGLFHGKPVLFSSVVGPKKMKVILAAIIVLFLAGMGRTWFIIVADKMAEKDIGWCVWMPDRDTKNACYSANERLIRDPALCENIIDSFKRDQCSGDVAARLNDTSICGRIEDKTDNYLCSLKFGFIGGFCYSDIGCRNDAKCVNNICQ